MNKNVSESEKNLYKDGSLCALATLKMYNT